MVSDISVLCSTVSLVLMHRDNLSNILSGLYAMFLVVVGASIPLAKVFAVEITPGIFEVHLLPFLNIPVRCKMID